MNLLVDRFFEDLDESALVHSLDKFLEARKLKSMSPLHVLFDLVGGELFATELFQDPLRVRIWHLMRDLKVRAHFGELILLLLFFLFLDLTGLFSFSFDFVLCFVIMSQCTLFTLNLSFVVLDLLQ